MPSGQTAVVFIDFDFRPVARRMHSDEDTIEVSVSLLMKSEFDHQILMFAKWTLNNMGKKILLKLYII